MKILHLEASPGWGGQEMRILKEAEGMRSRGHEVFLAVMEGGALIREACKAGFTVSSLPFQKTGWGVCLPRLLALIRRHRIDIVNTHSSLDAWIGGIAARLAGRPVVRTRHLSTPIKKGWNSRILYGKLADFVVTTCSSIVPVICDTSGKPRGRCCSIPTGVDSVKMGSSPLLSEQFRSQLGVLPTDFLVGTACFMRSWKGIADFLKAADLLRGNPEVKWVIVGGGHEEAYRRMAAEWKLDGIVHFTGHLPDPSAALNALDVFALLSTAHEGVSQSILQAAFLGKPLIATAIGGLGEVCLDRKTGLRVDPFSPEQVAQAILELKNDPGLGCELGRCGRLLVEERFLIEHTINAMERVYTSFVYPKDARRPRPLGRG